MTTTTCIRKGCTTEIGEDDILCHQHTVEWALRRHGVTPAVAEALAGADGTTVTLTEHELETDVDGAPLGVTRTETTATLVIPVDPLLGRGEQ